MDIELIKRLNQLNTDFYNTTAIDFDDSRHYFWQGWDKIPPFLDDFEDIRVADIGCGNGRFGQFLLEKCPQVKLSYTGIDANKRLLSFAEENLQGKIPALHLDQVDIIQSLLDNEDFLNNQKFQLITCFGVFHHVPSFELRLKLLKYLLSKLSANGTLIVSVWMFMEYERFRKKIIRTDEKNDSQKLEKYSLNLINLEKNDYILDWKRGTEALRFCHYIDEQEQNLLLEKSGAKLKKSFRADGKENDVNQYLILSHQS